MDDGGLSKTTRHEHARALLAHLTACQWRFLGHCQGPLEVAHVDGDDAHNWPTNLRKLCQSHHALLDRGRIQPAAPTQPGFYRTGAAGKRRYPRQVAGQLVLMVLVPGGGAGAGGQAQRAGTHQTTPSRTSRPRSARQPEQ